METSMNASQSCHYCLSLFVWHAAGNKQRYCRLMLCCSGICPFPISQHLLQHSRKAAIVGTPESAHPGCFTLSTSSTCSSSGVRYEHQMSHIIWWVCCILCLVKAEFVLLKKTQIRIFGKRGKLSMMWFWSSMPTVNNNHCLKKAGEEERGIEREQKRIVSTAAEGGNKTGRARKGNETERWELWGEASSRWRGGVSFFRESREQEAENRAEHLKAAESKRRGSSGWQEISEEER